MLAAGASLRAIGKIRGEVLQSNIEGSRLSRMKIKVSETIVRLSGRGCHRLHRSEDQLEVARRTRDHL